MANDKINWTGKSFGGYFGNLCFLKLLSLGMYPAYALLVFVAAYFQIFRSSACAGGRAFLSRVMERKVGVFSCELYKLLFSFGVCLLDRTSYLIGHNKIVIFDDCEDVIKNLISNGNGIVVLSAHIGGWAIAGAQLEKYGRKIFVAGADGEDPRLRELAQKVSKRGTLTVSSEGATGNIEAYSVLKNGGIVALHADRYAGGRYEQVKFLGSYVRAPVAAYALAKAARVPVIQTVCFREKLFTYRMKAFVPIDVSKKSPKECATEFMFNLEDAVRQYPYQWFNFYDFWK